jgi:hypothetical protein
MGASLGLGAAAVDQLIPALTALAPDIIVGAKGRNAYYLYECTCHELSHSMHFKKVGKSYWNKYIDGIIELRNKRLYGTSDTDSKYSGYIGVGETWGHAMGYYMANQKLSRSYDPDSYWFNPKKTKELLDNKDIMPLQFLNCMEGSVTDLHTLNEKLTSKYNVSKNLYY